MSTYPSDLRYTNDHEWLRDAGSNVTVGITQFAVDQLGDITLVDLPKEGDLVTKGQRFGTIESVKSVSDLYAPCSGTVAKVNGALKDAPELVNQEPYAGGWMIEIAPSERGELDELLSPDAYAAVAQ
jgi:glycine cleavage system H protein